MACTAFQPGMTAREQARYLHENIAPGLFRVADDETAKVAWRVSPEPYALAPATLERIYTIGNDLFAFYKALNTLYNRSARGTAPGFISEYLDQGKPEHIIRLSRQNRFKSELPGVIRPDLILTDDGFISSELDSVPGGMGFVGAMSEAYCKLGMESVGGSFGIPAQYAAMIKSVTANDNPTVAIVVSEESKDYRAELRWLADYLRAQNLLNAYVCAPQDLTFTEEALFLRLPDGRDAKVDTLYRNFEMFDLLNVPKQELFLYAARHNRIKMTPPPKVQLEEKLAFALLHHPSLAKLWQGELKRDTYERLRLLFPETWVIDPRPLPPQGVIAGLTAAGEPVSDWMQLATLGKSERDFVVKPSGFSELAWGSKGVRVANDLGKDEWTATLREAVTEYEKTPRILQRFYKGKRVRQPYLNTSTDEITTFDGRVRLCPYFFVVGDGVQLGGILATVAPADKRLIHGMTDAVMASCILKDDGN